MEKRKEPEKVGECQAVVERKRIRVVVRRVAPDLVGETVEETARVEKVKEKIGLQATGGDWMTQSFTKSTGLAPALPDKMGLAFQETDQEVLEKWRNLTAHG